jgi:hypothetical protein
MPLTTIHEAPALDSFTPLTEHQSQTPTTFFDAKPILHYHAQTARALISRGQVQNLPIFTVSQTTEAGQESEDDRVVEEVEVFVTSELVFCPLDVQAGLMNCPQKSNVIQHFEIQGRVNSVPRNLSACNSKATRSSYIFRDTRFIHAVGAFRPKPSK